MTEFGRSQPMIDAEFKAAVHVERDRRIAAGFYYGPHKFDWDDQTKARVTGAAALAGFAIAAGAQPGDYLWAGGGDPFVWVLQDNGYLPLDAQSMFAVSKVAAGHERDHVFAAIGIKVMSPRPSDITDDALWPVVGSVALP